MSPFDSAPFVDTTAINTLIDRAVAARHEADVAQSELDQALVDAARTTSPEQLADQLGVTTGWITGAQVRTRARKRRTA